jgi:uncharacterized protein (TIGR03083 family)
MILTTHLFRPLNDELIALLRGLSAEEWNATTVCPGWTVKDVAAHLLDSALRRLSAHRDGHALPPAGLEGGLAQFINVMNREWVSASRRLSPRILIEMLDVHGGEMADFLMTLDPNADAIWAVSWAGEETSANWFDVARELTERWHHQQQIRDATRRPPLYDPRFFRPVIETFVRALPHTYRAVEAPAGSAVRFQIAEVGQWSIVRNGERWILGEEERPLATVCMSGDTAWRLFTKGLTREAARSRVEISGDRRYGEPVLSTLAIVA